jgi:hypothetical protein
MSFSDLSLKPKSSVEYQVDNLRSVCEQFQIILEGFTGLAKGLTRIKSRSERDDTGRGSPQGRPQKQ